MSKMRFHSARFLARLSVKIAIRPELQLQTPPNPTLRAGPVMAVSTPRSNAMSHGSKLRKMSEALSKDESVDVRMDGSLSCYENGRPTPESFGPQTINGFASAHLTFLRQLWQ